MIIDKQPKENQEKYRDLIRVVSSISNMFSESDKPYIGYRVAENIFCMSFGADNLSRSDCSVDARLLRTGIGIKTFIASPGAQKVAEFNKDSYNFRSLPDEEIIRTISELRNDRIDFTKRTYGVDETIYHCLVRDTGAVRVFESPMEPVRLDKIRLTSSSKSTIHFTDGRENYSFSRSKSTLLKKFDCSAPLMEVDVVILDDPFSVMGEILRPIVKSAGPPREYVILPLYSKRGGIHVPLKSGLNQWNASGRKRDLNEVYIPIPAGVRNRRLGFFPGKDTAFSLRLPDGTTEMSAKICQDNEKSLMSNPNSALGEWILRTVLKLQPEELATYEMLERLHINSVVVYKNAELDYSIDFTFEDPFAEGETGLTGMYE